MSGEFSAATGNMTFIIGIHPDQGIHDCGAYTGRLSECIPPFLTSHR